MGEITEALRRAKSQRASQPEPDSRPDGAERENAVSRAGIDVSPPPSREAPRPPEPAAPRPIPLREAGTGDAEIAYFPREKTGPWQARSVLLEPNEPTTERFRGFALRVRREMERRRQKSVLVTSSIRAEGKTFTACNLALALASMAADTRIALLELDIRRPSAARGLGIAPKVGIEDVLADAAPLDAARIRTELSSLDLYLVRDIPARAHEILAGRRLEAICRALESRYDAFVIDSPPVLPVPDVSLVLPHVDACVAVVRAGRSRLRSAREMLDQLPREKVLGVFVNDLSAPRRSDQYDYYASEDEKR